ncbi:hypothetical protein [Cellulomonas sp. C5510]|uniref:hypothetical protein n=1 Tax=Cellulomonas sp. C5510 TaxID=2871170 RepID=UPI001C9413C5|nr:hypothetical protein [Cellulomonas sp. C5510]QZN85818.1 hypothetical protein K5O09_00865 [Cellulomonas sp. C5510]
MSNNLLVVCEGTIPLTADRFAEVARRRWPGALVRQLRPPRASAVDVQVVGPAGIYRISYFRDRRSFSCDALWPGWGEVAAWLRSVVPDDGRLLVAVDAALTMHVTLTPGITAAEFETRMVSHDAPGWVEREPEVAALLGFA